MRKLAMLWLAVSAALVVSIPFGGAFAEEVPDPTKLVLGSTFVAFHGCASYPVAPPNVQVPTCYIDYLRVVGKKSNGRVPVEDLLNGGVFYVRMENITYTRPMAEPDFAYLEQRKAMRELQRQLNQAPVPPPPGQLEL